MREHVKDMDPVFILQKRAIRIINDNTYKEPTNPVFIKLKTLMIEDLVDSTEKPKQQSILKKSDWKMAIQPQTSPKDMTY